MVKGGIHLSGLGAFYERRLTELKALVLDVDVDDVDDDVPCDTVRVICDKLAGRGASLKENIEMAQRCFSADTNSTDALTMRNRCEVVMKGEWKRMAKNGQRAWDHIADEHNQLPENVTMRAVFLRLVSPIGGLEAYCAHRLRESYPQNTDKLRDVSNEVCLFFRDVPKSMPAFKVTFMGTSPAYHGWLIVEPFTKDWFELRNDERAAWIAGAMNITVGAAKLSKSDSQGNAIRDLNLTPAHGPVESHPGLEWMRLYNAQTLRVNQSPRAGPANMQRRVPTDDLGREGWCPSDTYEQAKNSEAFLRSITDAADRMDSTFHTLDLEFSDDAKDGTLGSTCLQALERGWVSSWRVGVSKPELLDKNNTPLVASEVILTHDYTDPDDPIECLTGYTMTSKIKRDWMKANPPPLREGTPNSELLGWFKGTWLAELLTHHFDKIEAMVAGAVAERHNRIDEEIERQKRKEAVAAMWASAADQAQEEELRTECRMAADKFAEQRAADANKAPNMPPPVDLAKGSFSDCIHVVQEKKPVKKRESVVDFDTARALAASSSATSIQAVWRGRAARRRPVHQEMPLGCIDIAFRQGMPPGCIDIASTTQSVLEASIYAIDRGHRVAEKGATAAVRKKTRKKQPPPPPTRSCSVPSWWTREVTKQVPLGTNRIFHATSHDSEETRTSWVIGRVWPKHVAEARPSTMNNIVDHERQVAYAKIDPDWQRVLALTLSAQKSGLVKKWDIVFSYAINEHGREIVPLNLPKYTNPSVACAYTSTVYSEVTLPDGRTDRLTFEKPDPYGDCLVQMHFQRLVYHAARERAVPASISDEEERARLNAEALLREEDQEHRNKESKAKKKADARRACEKEQAKRAQLVREATEGAAKTLAAKQAASAAAHAEEQRRLAHAKKEERARAEAAKFEAVLAKKRADEAEAVAATEAAEAEAEAAENAALAEAYALKEAQEAAERAHAEEANRVRLAQAEMMARLRANKAPAPAPAPAPAAAPVTNGKGRGRANAGRGGRGGRGAVSAPAPPPEPKEDDDSKLCVVCFEEDKSRVCVPCGHVCMCSNCATNEKIKICPMCRVEITMVIPYFF